MIQNPQTIYLDEAGATGNNLLDPEQPYFVYASLAMSETKALSVHSGLAQRFRIRDRELKGSNLVKTNAGRQAIVWLWREIGENSKVMVSDKAYALAGKFFEYIFEPVLAAQSSMFYATGFHKFIATFLYVNFVCSQPEVQSILKGFSKLMKDHDPQDLEAILSPLDHLSASDALYSILTFACCHQERIRQEIRTMGAMGSGPRWDLELSQTSVHSLLAFWGEEFHALDAYCDASKPIQSNRGVFDQFIGREDKAYIQLWENRLPSIVYNLSRTINLVDSKQFPGVQLADVLASSLAYALRNKTEDFSQECLTLAGAGHVNCVLPDLKEIDLATEKAMLNLAILQELVYRSVRGRDPFEGMGDYIIHMRSAIPGYLSKGSYLHPIEGTMNT